MSTEITSEFVWHSIPPRPRDSHKGSFGTVLAVAGSAYYRGAALLAAEGALRTGAGIVTLASVEPVLAAAVARLPECCLCPCVAGAEGGISPESIPQLQRQKATVLLLGPGLGSTAQSTGRAAETRTLVQKLLPGFAGSAVLDADGLNAAAQLLAEGKTLPHPAGELIVTPHPGEMARLTGLSAAQINADRENTACQYKVFVGVADAALYYLPVMVAFTTATKFNCNKLVSVALAAAMIHPSVSALLATEGGAYFLGIKLQNIAYGGQVFPAILTVIFMSFIEKWANKWCPKAIRVFFVPMLCFGIGFPVALVVLGPLGYNIGALLTTVILALYNTLGWLAVALLAAVLPFMISMGMHKALVPYAVASISDPGFEMLYMPASLAHNISEGGACLGVALKTKDENLRATAISAGISGLFGITEPALYGVTLQHKKVMMSVVVSSFIGGLFVGLMKVKAFVAMGPGLAGMAMFVDPDNGKNILWAAVGLVISVVVSFALSFFLYKDETPAEDETAAPAPETAADAAAADSTISSPLQGKAIALEEVKDEVFSQKILGDGIAVVPEKGELYAPADGVIESVFGTKHAISMKTTAGAELLMHIGMDTVKRDGKGFDPQVKDGETVKKGQLLMKFDLDGIKADGYDVTTPIVVTNADEFTIKTVAEGAVVPGAALLKLEANK